MTEKGCEFLASALDSDLSLLRKLDVTYNQIGGKGVMKLFDIIEKPTNKLEELK